MHTDSMSLPVRLASLQVLLLNSTVRTVLCLQMAAAATQMASFNPKCFKQVQNRYSNPQCPNQTMQCGQN